ncbi:hypothetical protein BKA62DRAFT_697297 [Auriculariales sp. MPI-PUGE-AT-0066]|nr:hypothetical protein BKA62DRAFT_697297 [Auriculariales sp. MPI-PUGE-AT-0066]
MLFSTTRVFSIVAVVAASAQAAPSFNLTELLGKRDTFANFFDDDNCQTNGGIGVDMNNDGCLAERGRGSVYIPNTGLVGPANQYCLVKTHDSDACNCQNQGFDFTATGFCAKLDSSFGSYRFIHESCGPNNC